MLTFCLPHSFGPKMEEPQAYGSPSTRKSDETRMAARSDRITKCPSRNGFWHVIFVSINPFAVRDYKGVASEAPNSKHRTVTEGITAYDGAEAE